MKTVTFEQVKKYAEETGKYSAKKLMEQMESLKQGLILESEYQKVVEINECKCGQIIGTQQTMCNNCERAVKEVQKRQEIKLLWQQLLTDINTLNVSVNNYKLYEPKHTYDDLYIRREEKHGDNTLYCEIFLNEIYSNGYYKPDRKVLRIRTNEFDKEFRYNSNILNFKSNDVAKKLHNKCEELFKKMKTKYNTKTEKEEKTNNLVDVITSIFGDQLKKSEYDHDKAIDQRYIRRPGNRGGYISDAQTIKLEDDITLNTYDGKNYGVKSNKTFNVEQTKELVELIRKFNKENADR